ncbi:MAG: hypothetical protein M3P39_08255 [Actinomycetota bacterium]|nr:hypothetical protein [Actinomycetota bacterium]
MSTPYTEERTRGFEETRPLFGPGSRPPRPKRFFLTSEFLAFVAVATAVLLAAAVADGFDASRAWTLVTILAAAYIVSRGLSKIGRGDGSADAG